MAQLFLSLPPELCDHVVGYAQLKRLVNQAVSELSLALGLHPPSLDATYGQSANNLSFELHGCPLQVVSSSGELQGSCKPVIDNDNPSHATPSLVQPRLGLSLKCPPDVVIPSDPHLSYRVELHIPQQSLRIVTIQALARGSHPRSFPEDHLSDAENPPSSDLIIPLPTDAALFHLLTSDITSPSEELDKLMGSFNSALAKLAEAITQTAIPSSSAARRSFSAYSMTAGNALTLRPRSGGRSDLLAWREIFRLYGEVEVFESIGESSRGDRSVEDSETRLKLFTALAREKKSSLVLAGSQETLEAFLKLSMFILDVKKLEVATSKTVRKILQEHSKQTTLSIPSYLLLPNNSPGLPLNLMSMHSLAKPLSKLFIQALAEILLPVVPHIDDFSCLICTAIAFKPVRLRCGHFFCVRCLVKLQKRGWPDCPMCRAPTVLQANATNVDYALLNFMADWFPIESREKQRANDREVTQELMKEYRNARKRQRRSDGCLIM